MSSAQANTTPATVQSLAAEMLTWFETKTREGSGARFLCLKDGHPDWMQSVCREAHNSATIGLILPDDERYDMIYQALDAISEQETESGLEDAEFDLTAPDYNADLLSWLASHDSRACFCDAYREELGDGAPDLMGQIRDGFLYEIREVYRLVLFELQKLADQA